MPNTRNCSYGTKRVQILCVYFFTLPLSFERRHSFNFQDLRTMISARKMCPIKDNTYPLRIMLCVENSLKKFHNQFRKALSSFLHSVVVLMSSDIRATGSTHHDMTTPLILSSWVRALKSIDLINFLAFNHRDEMRFPRQHIDGSESDICKNIYWHWLGFFE